MTSGYMAKLESGDTLRGWLQCKGGYLHPSLRFVKSLSGMSVLTIDDLPSDSRVVSCPFSLAITPHSSKDALLTLSKLSHIEGDHVDTFTERELICTYIVMHWILDEDSNHSDLKSAATLMFRHLPYLRTLPPPDALRTSLHFSPEELSLLRGTNIYGATVDRKVERQSEWARCRVYAGTLQPVWKDRFTWQRYLTASTYLSSRAFPSTILTPTPSLISASSSYPVLLPGVDAFNHARGHRVSWVVDPIHSDIALSDSPPHEAYQISLIIHNFTAVHTEVFNNYGPKPNSELILGYGFSLPVNPDDTIVLRIGGRPEDGDNSSRTWEVGRDARGSEGLWVEMTAIFAQASYDDENTPAEWELELEAAETLKEMVARKLMVLPYGMEGVQESVRGDVLQMIQHYIEGQRDILQSLSAFADSKRECALTKARADGLELVFDDEDVV